MFSRASSTISFIFVLITLAAATTHTVTVTTYAPVPTPPPASQCNTDGLYCCNSVQQSFGNVVSVLLGLLDIEVAPITALVGANCSPIDVLGIGSGGQCTAQPVCCQNNEFSGLIVIGCTPITVGLQNMLESSWNIRWLLAFAIPTIFPSFRD